MAIGRAAITCFKMGKERAMLNDIDLSFGLTKDSNNGTT